MARTSFIDDQDSFAGNDFGDGSFEMEFNGASDDDVGDLNGFPVGGQNLSPIRPGPQMRSRGFGDFDAIPMNENKNKNGNFGGQRFGIGRFDSDNIQMGSNGDIFDNIPASKNAGGLASLHYDQRGNFDAIPMGDMSLPEIPKPSGNGGVRKNAFDPIPMNQNNFDSNQFGKNSGFSVGKGSVMDGLPISNSNASLQSDSKTPRQSKRLLGGDLLGLKNQRQQPDQMQFPTIQEEPQEDDIFAAIPLPDSSSKNQPFQMNAEAMNFSSQGIPMSTSVESMKFSGNKANEYQPNIIKPQIEKPYQPSPMQLQPQQNILQSPLKQQQTPQIQQQNTQIPLSQNTPMNVTDPNMMYPPQQMQPVQQQQQYNVQSSFPQQTQSPQQQYQQSNSYQAQQFSPPIQQIPIEIGFSSSLDRSIANFKRVFTNEFSSLIRQQPSNPINIEVDEFVDKLNTEVMAIIEAPITPVDINAQSIARRISAAIDEHTKPVSSSLAEAEARNSVSAERHISELRQLQEELESLRQIFKTNSDGVLRELDRERHNSASIRDTELSRIRDIEQHLRTLKLKQVELSTKSKNQQIEKDSIERSTKTFEQKRREWEEEVLPKLLDESGALRNRILDELSSLRSDITQESSEELSNVINEGITIIQEEGENLRNELIELEMSNRWVINKYRDTPKKSPSKKMRKSSVIDQTQEKLDRIRKRRAESMKELEHI